MSDLFIDSASGPIEPGGLCFEVGGLDQARILAEPAATHGMIMVGRDGEDYLYRPELRWQVWPDLLLPVRRDVL